MVRPTSVRHPATNAPAVRTPSSPNSLIENATGSWKGVIKKDAKICALSYKLFATMSCNHEPNPTAFSHDDIFLLGFCTSNLSCVQPY